MFIDFPNEISNHICSYVESYTNNIMKHMHRDYTETKFDINFDPVKCLKLNRAYNFKHINIKRLHKAIHTKCPHCLHYLTSQEYLRKCIYDRWFNKKLCVDCLDRESGRLVFEMNEFIIFVIIILAINWRMLILFHAYIIIKSYIILYFILSSCVRFFGNAT